ncbi:MAG: PIN domain-containing protein [Pseudomonadota bacterium]
MKKYIIDTNALISFVTDRNSAQQTRIAEIFEIAAGLRALIVCPQNVLTEFVYVMDKVYHIPKKEIATMIGDFIVTPGVEVVHEINLDILLTLWPKNISDYGDAIVASLSKNIKGAIVATFDRTFRSALKKLGLPVLPL